MDFSVGDIVLFRSSIAGKAKYHFCFFFNEVNGAYSLMFLNSEGQYEDHFTVPCEMIPEIPASRTGQSIFSCPTVIRKSALQMQHLQPTRICALPVDVAKQFLDFAASISTMTINDKRNLVATLTAIVAR